MNLERVKELRDKHGLLLRDAVKVERAERCTGMPYKHEPDELTALRARVARLEEDEKRINTLRELCGYVEDGSNTFVTIGQDDATKDWVLHIGNRKQTLVFSATFRELFDIARRALEEK